MVKIAIIGAGFSGLSAAHLLKNDADITLFEKARGVGGRMSTRRATPYFFDHGAQYFTVCTQPFQSFIQPLIDQNIIKRWDPRYINFDDKEIIERKNWSEENPRYVGVPGMNMVAKHLAKDFNFHINTKITSLHKKGKWQLTDDQGQQYLNFDWVISSVPSPQLVDLMPENFKYKQHINTIKMHPCFSLMLGFEKKFPLEFEAAHITNSDLSWIGVNSHKPERANLFTLIIHSSEKYAKNHINHAHEEVMGHLVAETSRIIGYNLKNVDYKALHLWRYTNTHTRGSSKIFLDYDNKIGACGDWCVGGRVEGAFTSAYNLANKMKEYGL